jgi:hypothetical protein
MNGWAEVATKRDLDALETKIELKLERTVHRLTWRFLTFQLVSFISLAGLILARS